MNMRYVPILLIIAISFSFISGLLISPPVNSNVVTVTKLLISSCSQYPIFKQAMFTPQFSGQFITANSYKTFESWAASTNSTVFSTFQTEVASFGQPRPDIMWFMITKDGTSFSVIFTCGGQ